MSDRGRAVVQEGELEAWNPRTRLGRMVAAGQVSSLAEIFEQGWRIKEPEIVKALMPDLKSIVVGAGIVQKQTDAGEITRFAAVVAVGNEDGWLGVGRGKASQMRIAIEKATNTALMRVIPVKRGCGSWECRCGRPHSIPYKTEGKAGSVRVVLLPGPRGLGLVAGETIKTILGLAGIKDVWTRTYGSTSTVTSIAYAVYEALKNMHKLSLPE